MLGMAGTAHRRSVIYRRVFPSVRGIIERSREIFARGEKLHSRDSYNEQLHIWRLADDRVVEFAACQYEKDAKKQQGQARDFIGFDEATEFPEAIVRFLSGWNRTTIPGQRCRMLLTFNPPMDDSGAWVVRYFAPWLDERYPDKALDGELRYVVRLDDRDLFYRSIEDIPDDQVERLQQQVEELKLDKQGMSWYDMVKSRTFFRASLADNPILAATGYGATIEALPEPLRSILKGNFTAGRLVDPWQIISRVNVEIAIERWKARAERIAAGEQDAHPGPLSALGVDVARGGEDETAIAPRHGLWYGEIDTHPGRATPDGPAVAGLVLQKLDELDQRTSDPAVNVDVIGVGGSAYDQLVDLVRAQPVNVAERAESGGYPMTDRSGKLRFANLRSALWWQLREDLDPNHGEPIELPPDDILVAELCAPRFEVRAGVIHVESKDSLRTRLGRSTNRADALLLSRALDQGWLLA